MIAQFAASVMVAVSRPVGGAAVRRAAAPPVVVCEVRGGDVGIPLERNCLWLPSSVRA